MGFSGLSEQRTILEGHLRPLTGRAGMSLVILFFFEASKLVTVSHKLDLSDCYLILRLDVG